MTEQQDIVEFVGGPMDGYRCPVTGWTPEQRAAGVAHISPSGAYGPDTRSLYGPADDDPAPGTTTVWVWQGDIP